MRHSSCPTKKANRLIQQLWASMRWHAKTVAACSDCSDSLSFSLVLINHKYSNSRRANVSDNVIKAGIGCHIAVCSSSFLGWYVKPCVVMKMDADFSLRLRATQDQGSGLDSTSRAAVGRRSTLCWIRNVLLVLSQSA